MRLQNTPQKTLESWKQIAAYLDRSERTVRRMIVGTVRTNGRVSRRRRRMRASTQAPETRCGSSLRNPGWDKR